MVSGPSYRLEIGQHGPHMPLGANLQELVRETEMSVEPVDFSVDELCWHETSLGQDLCDFSLLRRLEREGR